MVIPSSFPFFFPRSGVVALTGYGIRGNKVSGDLCVFFIISWLQFPMSLPISARVVRCVSAGNWAATGPVTKNKNREERRNIYIYI